VISRYFIRLAYEGTDYCGWQIQPNAITVQAVIEQQLSQLYNRPIKVIGCGRTDTGVHASDFFLHTDLEDTFSVRDLRFKLENMLPKSIAIKSVHPVAEDAHTVDQILIS